MKHTKEYAEKMYLKQLIKSGEIGFTDGYMKAIEETNVKELLDALKTLKQAYITHCDKPSTRLIIEIEAIIKKAE